MAPGATMETVDGMSLEKINTIIEALRHERYRWTSVRRTYIPQKNHKRRPLGLPTWSDKLFQEVIRLILEAYYDPQFSDNSHGFQPQRGCHTALRDVTQKGGVVSPILSNLVLDRLDQFVERELIPVYTCGKRQRTNPPYVALTLAASDARKQGNLEEA